MRRTLRPAKSAPAQGFHGAAEDWIAIENWRASGQSLPLRARPVVWLAVAAAQERTFRLRGPILSEAPF